MIIYINYNKNNEQMKEELTRKLIIYELPIYTNIYNKHYYIIKFMWKVDTIILYSIYIFIK